MSLPGLNIAPTKYISISPGLTCDTDEEDDVSLLGGASLALDPALDYIYILDDDSSLTCVNVYLPRYKSLGASTTTVHPSASNVKQATSLLTQEFNAALNKSIEYNASALAETVTFKLRMA